MNGMEKDKIGGRIEVIRGSRAFLRWDGSFQKDGWGSILEGFSTPCLRGVKMGRFLLHHEPLSMNTLLHVQGRGDEAPAPASVSTISNVLKTKHDTAKNSIR